MVGLSLIQHLENDEVSLLTTSTHLVIESVETIVVGSESILGILAECQSSDLHRSADLS